MCRQLVSKNIYKLQIFIDLYFICFKDLLYPPLLKEIKYCNIILIFTRMYAENGSHLLTTQG